MSTTILDDTDVDSLIIRLSRPIPAADRERFAAAARTALADMPVHGPGSNFRALRDLQRLYFSPPTDGRAHWDIEQEISGPSKLKSLPPIERNGDLRRARYRKHAR